MLTSFVDRAAADRARRRRLHAGGRARAGGRPARLLRRGAERRASARRSCRVDVSFGDVVQVFNIGAASCGTYGTPAGIWAAAERYGSDPARRAGRAGRRAGARGRRRQRRAGVPVRHPLADHGAHSRESRALYLPAGARIARASGTRCRSSPTRWSASPPTGRRRSTRATSPPAVVEWVGERGGTLTLEDLAAYEAVPREPVRVAYRGREVLTNPPPSAGGTLLAYALALLDRAHRPAVAVRGRRRDGARAGRAHAGVPGGPRRAVVPARRSWPPASGRRRTSR